MAVGTYWLLETRRAKWHTLKDIPLKNAAKAIDAKLRESPFQTVMHGDAKLENFFFQRWKTGRSPGFSICRRWMRHEGCRVFYR